MEEYADKIGPLHSQTAAAQATQEKMSELHVIERMDKMFDQVEERLDKYIDSGAQGGKSVCSVLCF
jgi:hypothetical protein